MGPREGARADAYGFVVVRRALHAVPAWLTRCAARFMVVRTRQA